MKDNGVIASGPAQIMSAGKAARKNMSQDDIKTETRRLLRIYHDENYTENERNQAFSDAVILNEGFVGQFVSKYYNAFGAYFDDLYMAGLEGLILAMQKYDTDSPYMLSTYATSWMRGCLTDALNHLCGVSSHYGMHISKVNKAITRLENAGIMNPSPEQIARESGLNIDAVYVALQLKEQQVVKLCADDDYLHNVIKENAHNFMTKGPEEICEENEKNQALYEALSKLSPTEMKVILLKFGFVPEKKLKSEYDFKTIAKEINETPEDTKRIYYYAIRKLGRDKKLLDVYSFKRERVIKDTLYSEGNNNKREISANVIMDECEMELNVKCKSSDKIKSVYIEFQ